ncbi:unnamed protein product [Aureobasidium vineae]|uniref:Rhodopsin domain-containing protein n=1 Tax=Aureobasidium vineae TaxID=2773715 RepID=A0A9N8J9N0_9PEZI|nr:unnamed protein product [Aureobasidium vineae]
MIRVNLLQKTNPDANVFDKLPGLVVIVPVLNVSTAGHAVLRRLAAMSQAPQYWIEPSKLELMRALNGTFLALSCITVALRVYTRTRIVRCWGWDDWFMLLTLLICAEQALYIAGTVCLKISLAFFFLRFLIVRWARYIVWISVLVYSTVATAMLLLVVFECGLPGNYVIKQATGKCVTFRLQSSLGYAHGAINALTDWVFPVLAIHFLIRCTKMSLAAKLSCCAILLLAVVGSIASIVRTVYIPEIGPGGNIYSRSMKPLIWTIVEGALGIIAASLATLRPLFQRCAGRTRVALQSKSTGSRSTCKFSNSLGSTLNCFGTSARPALDESPRGAVAEKCDTMDLESGNYPKTTTLPLRLGVLSSLATETGMMTKMDMTGTIIRGTESAP